MHRTAVLGTAVLLLAALAPVAADTVYLKAGKPVTMEEEETSTSALTG